MTERSHFDPDAAAAPGAGVFGLPHGPGEAELILLPVPFDATQSYGHGAARGPAAMLRASHQVDLYDLQTGRPYRRGIHLLAADSRIEDWNRSARAAAEPLIAAGGAGPGDAAAVAAVDRAGAAVNGWVREQTARWLDAGKLVGVVGGDHSVPYGAIAEAAAREPGLGILHVDAHADLRVAFEGFAWSHASIMANVLRDCPGVARVVQVGVRDFGESERRAIEESEGRVVCWFDHDLRRRLARGHALHALLEEIVAPLPDRVWVSFDIDGLEPSLCPHTGTPVPGGLSFVEACLLLEAVGASGRTIAGFDLTEVAPGPEGDEWDANVGARVLYKLCGFALLGR